MKYTSAQAAKLLRKLEEEASGIRAMEDQSKTFLASLEEDEDDVRPAYDYEETQKKLDGLNADIRKVKHAINLFNTTHTVPGFDMTIDQALVYMPQLSARRSKLGSMKLILPKVRESSYYGRGSGIIDYRYANYDIDRAAEDFEKVSDELARLQTALDLVNSTEEMEIDL